MKILSRCLSVVTVVKEDAIGLRATMRSVARQAGNYQHVIVDGGSTSTEMLRALDEARRLGLTVVSEPDDGCYDAMNKGAALATGDCLAFLNAGDEYVGQVAVDQLLALGERAMWGFGAVQISGASGTRVYRFSPYRRLIHRLGIGWVPHPSSVIQRELFVESGGFQPTFGHAADQALFLSISKVLEPATTREVISRFRLGGISSQNIGSADVEFHHMRIAGSEPLFGSAAADAVAARGLALGRRVVRSVLSR
jgi:glycosyltransferase involved in cell wall biosynthesis